ncbi:MAG TPA: alpha-amylase family glycosyl hydrolase [Acidimicrobiales bacterium]
MPTAGPWWRSDVVYQIYPRSFLDTNRDGVGDLEGIRQRLNYLEWLGIDALWLSPVFRSPMRDFGYDVADYCDVDPVFGDLADLDALVADAHGRDIRVILDWVPNHTSDQHPWFVDSRSSPDASHRDWYVWRDPAPDGGPPNNWIRAWSDLPAWTFDEASGQYYLHCFLPEQPDLNWANPEVEAAMHEVLRFWLDRGIDGFRMDVIHLIGKDPSLPDDPADLAGLSHVPLNDRPETHTLLRGLRRLLDAYPGDRVSVGEVYLLDTAQVVEYLGAGDELHLAFNFPPLFAPWDAAKWRRQIEIVGTEHDPIGAWPTWVLSNHDNRRHRTRFGTEARARAAAVLLLTLRGTPFLYAGEELGQEDGVIPAERVVDPGGRDGCRSPIPWTPDAAHGWSGSDPWLPWPPAPETRNAESETDDPSSILHLYRRMLAARRASDALRAGSLTLLDDVAEGVLAYIREGGDDRRAVVINFTDQALDCIHPALTGTVEVASDGVGEGAPFSGVLGPDQALVLRP